MKNILTKLFAQEELSREEARDILVKVSEGAYSDVEIASFLTVFQMRGVTVDELIGFREALQLSQPKLHLEDYKAIDIVGTGGDGKNTFNISTCACFVVAGAGYKVVKHGNYGATSVSGASNVVERHGVKFTAEPDKLRRSLDECNIAYLHAPLFTPALKGVAPVRKALKVRTIFNLLGPLVNPAKPYGQLLGVADLSQIRLYSNVLQKLGMGFAIVTSTDGYDEISLTDTFKVNATNYDRLYRPEELGLPVVKAEELYGGETPEEAAKIFDNVLEGHATAGQRDVVAVNSAFAIQILEPEKSISDCLAEAFDSIESGRALKTLKEFIRLNS